MCLLAACGLQRRGAAVWTAGRVSSAFAYGNATASVSGMLCERFSSFKYEIAPALLSLSSRRLILAEFFCPMFLLLL